MPYMDRLRSIVLTSEDESFVLELVKLLSRLWRSGEDAKVAELTPLLSSYLGHSIKRCVITSTGAQTDGGIFHTLSEGQQVVSSSQCEAVHLPETQNYPMNAVQHIAPLSGTFAKFQS